jgi:hypothetical protein
VAVVTANHVAKEGCGPQIALNDTLELFAIGLKTTRSDPNRRRHIRFFVYGFLEQSQWFMIATRSDAAQVSLNIDGQ